MTKRNYNRHDMLPKLGWIEAFFQFVLILIPTKWIIRALVVRFDTHVIAIYNTENEHQLKGGPNDGQWTYDLAGGIIWSGTPSKCQVMIDEVTNDVNARMPHSDIPDFCDKGGILG